MAHANGKITAPVGIDSDIAPVLGVGSYDLGYLCSNAHGKINMWARYKPVRYASLAPGENEKWWQATDGSCGITPKLLTSYHDSVNFSDGSLNGWFYAPPTGGNVAPYRALDFDGYNHNAKPPISNFYAPEQATNQFTSSSFSVACIVAVASEGSHLSDELTLGDIRYIADCYFGIYVKQRNGSQARRVTSKNTIGTGAATAEMKTYGMPTGTWDIYPFLCTEILEQDASDVVNACYSVPMLSSRSIEIISSYVSVIVLPGVLPSVSGSTTVTLRVRNNSGSTMSFRNNAWQTRFVDKNLNDTMMIGERHGKIPDFDVSGNEQKDIPVLVDVSSELIQAKNAKVIITLDNANYIGSSLFMVAPNPEPSI